MTSFSLLFCTWPPLARDKPHRSYKRLDNSRHTQWKSSPNHRSSGNPDSQYQISLSCILQINSNFLNQIPKNLLFFRYMTNLIFQFFLIFSYVSFFKSKSNKKINSLQIPIQKYLFWNKFIFMILQPIFFKINPKFFTFFSPLFDHPYSIPSCNSHSDKYTCSCPCESPAVSANTEISSSPPHSW